MSDAKMLAALMAAEPVLADMERIVNKRMPGDRPFRMPELVAVREAIAAADGKCTEPECPYNGQQRARSCLCAKGGAA